MNSLLCAGCGSTPRRPQSGFCSDSCALNFGQAMQDHAHLSVGGMIKLPASHPIAEALKIDRALPEHVVFSIGARLYYVGGKRDKAKKKESEKKRAKKETEEQLEDITDPRVAREVAAAVARAEELEQDADVVAHRRRELARAAATPSSSSTQLTTYVPQRRRIPFTLVQPSSLSVAPPTATERSLIQRAEQYVHYWTDLRLRDMLRRGEFKGTFLSSAFFPADIFGEMVKYLKPKRPVVQNPERLHYVRTLPIANIESAAIAFDTNGDLIVGSDDGRLELLSANDGSLIKTYAPRQIGQMRHSICVGTMGVFYCSNRWNNRIEVWRSSDGIMLTATWCKFPECMALNFDETKLCVISDRNNIIVFDVSVSIALILFDTIAPNLMRGVERQVNAISDVDVLSDETILFSLYNNVTGVPEIMMLSRDRTEVVHRITIPIHGIRPKLLVDGSDNIFVLSPGAHVVAVFDRTGRVITWTVNLPGRSTPISIDFLLHPSGEIGIQAGGEVHLFSSAVVPALPAITSSSSQPTSSLSLPRALPPPPPVLAVVGAGVEIRPSQTGYGYGLFATRAFRRGEPITAYTGALTRWDTAMKLPGSATSHMRSHIAMTWVIDGLRLPDGTLISNPPEQLRGLGGGAMANDARGTLHSNNAEFDHYDSSANLDPFNLNPNERITFLSATADIAPGQEIFIDYGKTYWERRK